MLDFLRGPLGEWSMKRAFAVICLAVAIAVAFVKGDAALVGVFLVPAAAVLAAGAATAT